MASSEQTAVLSNALYDRLKFIALILLPALGTLVFAIGNGFEWGATDKVVGTITAIDAFLGSVLQLNTNKYYKTGSNFDGDVVVTPEDGGNHVTVAADRPLEDVVDDPGKHSVELQIVRRGVPKN